MKLTITLSDKQADVLAKALDLYARVMVGQLEIVEEVLRFSHGDLDRDRLFQARGLLDSAKTLLWGFSPGASYGIHNNRAPDAARQAYDIMRAIQSCIARTRAAQSSGVLKGEPPRQTSLEEKIPEVQVEL